MVRAVLPSVVRGELNSIVPGRSSSRQNPYTVLEFLELARVGLYAFPTGPVYVAGNVVIEDAAVSILPSSLYIQGSLVLRGSSIRTLPRDLHTDGDIDLRGSCVTSISSDTRVLGSLDLSDSLVTEVAAGLQVRRDLIVRNAPLTTLPQHATIGGSLNLTGSRMTALDPSLQIGGDLYLTGSEIQQLPDWITRLGYRWDGTTRHVYIGDYVSKENLEQWKHRSVPGMQIHVESGVDRAQRILEALRGIYSL